MNDDIGCAQVGAVGARGKREGRHLSQQRALPRSRGRARGPRCAGAPSFQACMQTLTCQNISTARDTPGAGLCLLAIHKMELIVGGRRSRLAALLAWNVQHFLINLNSCQSAGAHAMTVQEARTHACISLLRHKPAR